MSWNCELRLRTENVVEFLSILRKLAQNKQNYAVFQTMEICKASGSLSVSRGRPPPSIPPPVPERWLRGIYYVDKSDNSLVTGNFTYLKVRGSKV
jgi:hypothetical protein